MRSPIEYLSYKSLAELYEHYIREFLERSPIIAACGCRIHCYEHHFVHVADLAHPDKPNFCFPDVKEEILATTEGFGLWKHDSARAIRFLATLETIRNPDCVVRSQELHTTDRTFIKEFSAVYPYMAVLMGKDDRRLTLRTAFPFKRGRLRRWKRGEILYELEDS